MCKRIFPRKGSNFHFLLKSKQQAPIFFLKGFSCWHIARFGMFLWGVGRRGKKRTSSAFGGGWLLKCTVWCSCSWKCVHIFLRTCVQVRVHQSFCFMYFLCDYAHPAVSFCVLRCAQASVFAALSTPLWRKYCSSGEAEPSGPGQSSTGETG